jgi:uncharacterized protein YdaU (DUF1376 family)
VKPPAFQFYADDFIAGTAILTTEEIGAYILLLCYQWNSGGIPNDDDLIRRIAKLTQAFPLGLLKTKFKVVDGLLKNERLELERDKQKAFREKQARNGSLGGRPKTQAYPKPIPTANPNKTSPSPSPSPSPIEEEQSLRSRDEKGKKVEKANPPEIVIPATLAASPEFVSAWGLWSAHLKSKRKPSTPQATRMQLKKLEGMGLARAVEAINYSIEKNWQGIYEEKNQPGGAAVIGAKAPTIWEMKQIIEVKQERANKLKAMYAVEGPLTTEWSDEAKRKEFVALRYDIKTLNARIGSQ